MTDDERSVLADELIQRGEPLGELIALMLARDALPADAHVVRRNAIEHKIATHLDRHHDVLYGDLAPHVQRLSRPDLRDPALVVEKWHAGLDSVRIQRRLSGFDVADVLRAMRTAPVARFVRYLEIAVGDHVAALDELARERPAELRGLVVGGWWSQMPGETRITNLAGVVPLLAELEQFELRYAVEYMAFEAPALMRLSLSRSNDEFWTSTTHFDAHVPAIEDLALYNFYLDRTLFARYPTLRRVALGATFEAGWLEHFLLSDLSRLEKVYLRGATFGDREIEALAQHAHRVPQSMNLIVRIPAGNVTIERYRAVKAELPPNVEL